MRFSFDHAKRASNRKKHGLDLADAQQVIESGQTVTFEECAVSTTVMSDS